MTTSQPTSDRPMRADARRNRESVLAAARAAFAECGLEAQIDDIARRAGVGVGTVYRHFPAKEDLLEALAADHFDDMEARARECLEDPDPWNGLVRFIEESARHQATNRSFAEVMATQRGMMRAQAMAHPELHDLLARLVARGQEAGVVRTDVSGRDIPMLVCSIGRAMRSDLDGPPTDAGRFLGLMVDGLRAGGRSQLPAWDDSCWE